MALTLDIDGEKIENPGPAEIARAFEALEKEKSRFFSPGITLAILTGDETHSLTATGTREAGFLLSYQDGDADFEYNTGLEQAVPFEEAIKIFQAYAAGENWGQANFNWERVQVAIGTPRILKRLLLIAIIGFLAFMLIRMLIAK